MMSRSAVYSLRAGLATALAVFLLSAGGCSKDKKGEGGEVPGDGSADFSGDSDSGRAGGLQTINFDFDSFSLTADAKAKLQQNAKLLRDSSSLKVEIQGHCDSRGGIQYNLALGEKRAMAVKKYLADLGVGADRLNTISYGEERPLDPAENESAWAKNRRANFAVLSR